MFLTSAETNTLFHNTQIYDMSSYVFCFSLRRFACAAIIAHFLVSAAFSAEYARAFETGSLPRPPSFKYGGSAFPSGGWKKDVKKIADSPESSSEVVSYTSPDGLVRVVQNATFYKKFGICECKTKIENVGTERSKIIEDFKPYRLELENKPKKTKLDGVNIRRLRGSDTSYTDFCPDDFFLERRSGADKMSMENVCGYSSSEWMPYIGIDFDSFNGLNLAVGWSGGWRADFAISDFKFEAEIGMRATRFYLEPKESLMQPSILEMRRANMRIADAQNVWRRFILKHKTPKGADGKPYITPMVVSGGGSSPDGMFAKTAEAVREFGIEAELLGVDAGWYGGDHMPKRKTSFGDWVERAGDWRVNSKVRPDGLKNISEAAHKSGMVFSLWCEIERVMPLAPLHSEHPEYLLPSAADPNMLTLLNLGNPDAWKWAFDTISDIVDKHGIDVWRIDSHGSYRMGRAWERENEKNPDRVGVAEMKHVAGFYALWDELKKKYPHLQFDNCASGGKRLDYESMSRAFSVWRSDVQCHRDDEVAEASQIQNYYLHMWLPSHSGGNGSNIDDTYKYVSSISSGMMVGAALVASGKHTERVKKLFSTAKRIRKYITRDFYQLLSSPEKMENWCAYQGHDPDSDSGFFIAFRRKASPAEKVMLNLSAIDGKAVYELEDRDGKKAEISGKRLKDIVVALPPRDYALFFYSKKK